MSNKHSRRSEIKRRRHRREKRQKQKIKETIDKARDKKLQSQD